MPDLYHGDCIDHMAAMEPDSVDTIITDPPYGFGIEEWDTASVPDAFWSECNRLIRTGFLAVFCQMPVLADWHSVILQSGFRYCEHIAWVKRLSVPSYRLSRCHESVLIYTNGPSKFYETKGPYEDVKLPGVLVDTITLEGIDRHIKDLRGKLNGTSNGIRTGTSRHPAYERFGDCINDRSPEQVNFTNVWSFLPCQSSNRNGEHIHPTAKPVAIMSRLVEMLSDVGHTVYDPFMGSGSTGVAAVLEGRPFIGAELDAEYFDIARRRIEAAQMQLRMPLEAVNA